MISVIIPTYKEPEYLNLCIKSAISGQRNQNQILVIVDGFYEENREVLEKYDSQIDIINLKENQGLCRAINIGVYNSRFDKILVVNDDNVFPDNWDNDLLCDYEHNSVLSPNQIEPSPSMFSQFNIKDLGKSVQEFNFKKFIEYSNSIKKEDIDYHCGSTLPFLINKTDFLRLGGWDENYPTNGVVADWDFFLKCNLSNLSMNRTYKSHFYHFAQIATGKNRQYEENHAHQYAKYKWGSYIKHDNESNLKYID
jgi:glycosyltransferase involved in cell wall biosynthesis